MGQRENWTDMAVRLQVQPLSHGRAGRRRAWTVFFGSPDVLPPFAVQVSNLSGRVAA